MTFDELLVALKTHQDMASSLKVTINKLKRQILETKEAGSTSTNLHGKTNPSGNGAPSKA